MIFDTISNSIAALAMLTPVEGIVAAVALVVNVAALAAIRWVQGDRRVHVRDDRQPDLRDAA